MIFNEHLKHAIIDGVSVFMMKGWLEVLSHSIYRVVDAANKNNFEFVILEDIISETRTNVKMLSFLSNSFVFAINIAPVLSS